MLAFLDIMPRSPGHTLVIPKAPARNILDITPDDYAHVARAAHKIAAAAMKAFNADGITVQQFNEPAGGQVVFHLHMHVMPRWEGDTNFMSTVGETRVLSEDLPTTYRKLLPKF